MPIRVLTPEVAAKIAAGEVIESTPERRRSTFRCAAAGAG